MAQEVKVSSNALIGLVVGLVLSLMAVAFLLGRQSSPQTTAPLAQQQPETPPSARPLAVQPLPPEPAPAPPAPAPLAPPPAPMPAPAPLAAPIPEPIAPPAPKVKPAPVAPEVAAVPEAPPVPPTGKDPAIKTYFEKLDNALLGTQSFGDANQMATQILQQGLQGNTAGFDEIIDTTRKTLDNLRKISVPDPCKEHARLLRAQLEQSISLIEKVKEATVSMDTEALKSLANDGRKMQAEAQRFKQLDEALRGR